MSALVEIEAGTDETVAQALLAACRAAGFQVELRVAHNANSYSGLHAYRPHTIWAHPEDAEEVRELIAQSLPPEADPSPIRRSGTTRLAGWVLFLALIGIPALFWILVLVGRLF